MVSGRQGNAVQITTQTGPVSKLDPFPHFPCGTRPKIHNVWSSEEKFMMQLLYMCQHAGSPEWTFNLVIDAVQGSAMFAKACDRMRNLII